MTATDSAKDAVAPRAAAEPRDAAGAYMASGVAATRTFVVVAAAVALLAVLLAGSTNRTLVRTIDRGLDALPGHPSPNGPPAFP